MGEGGELRLALRSFPGGEAAIEVTGTGPGIREEDAEGSIEPDFFAQPGGMFEPGPFGEIA